MFDYEVCYQEFNDNGKIVTKRRKFKTARAFNKFMEQLFQKDNFHKILAYR